MALQCSTTAQIHSLLTAVFYTKQNEHQKSKKPTPMGLEPTIFAMSSDRKATPYH